MESNYGTFVITKRNWKGFELFGHGCGARNSYGGENTITAYETAILNGFQLVTATTTNPRVLSKKSSPSSRIQEESYTSGMANP